MSESEQSLVLDLLRGLSAEVKANTTAMSVLDLRLSKLEYHMGELGFREKERNGHIADLVNWKSDHQDEADRAAAILEGRQAQRAEDKDRLALIWDKMERPVLYGITGVGIAAGGILLNLVLKAAEAGGLWPF